MFEDKKTMSAVSTMAATIGFVGAAACALVAAPVGAAALAAIGVAALGTRPVTSEEER